MFGHRFFGARFFGNRFFGESSGQAVEPPAVVVETVDTGGGGGGWMMPRLMSKRKRKQFEGLWESLMALYDELSADAVAPVTMQKPVVTDYVKPAQAAPAPMAVNPPPQIDFDALRRDMARLYMLIEQNRKLIEDQDEEEAEMLLMM